MLMLVASLLDFTHSLTHYSRQQYHHQTAVTAPPPPHPHHPSTTFSHTLRSAMSKDSSASASATSTLFMITLREFGSVGESTVGLELSLDPRFKSSQVDLVLDEESRECFRKQQNPLVFLSLSRASSDTVLVLCALRSLGWTLVTSNALVANKEEFHRMFYFEQNMFLDAANCKKVASPNATGSVSVAKTATPSLDSTMDQKKQHMTTKSKPMSVFKQLAAKRMSAQPLSLTPSKQPTSTEQSIPVTTPDTTPGKTPLAQVTGAVKTTSIPVPTPLPTPPVPDLKPNIKADAEDNEDEDEGGDNFEEPKPALQKKRSSINMLFSDVSEPTENDDEPKSTTTPSSNIDTTTIPSPSVKSFVPPVKNSFSLPKKESQEGSAGGLGGSGGPPVTGAAGRKKPGRLSILQLNVGKDFNPAMLAGAKPGGPVPLGKIFICS